MSRCIVLVAVLGLVAGCYSSPWECGITCGQGRTCPSGLACGQDDRCWPEAESDRAACDRAADSGGTTTDATPMVDACVSSPEECNGIDDDCNDSIDEGFPGTGMPCDGPDSDECVDGVMVCLSDGSGTVCSDDANSTVERCNGEDDDCDGVNDEDFPVDGTCDGPDTDECTDDRRVCSSDGLATVCEDRGPLIPELCDANDNDCDEINNEGFPVGEACDSDDADTCNDDRFVCDSSGTGTICEDRGPAVGNACDSDDVDTCNDDRVVCNSSGTGAICEDRRPSVGEACDGSDPDVCFLGSFVCDTTGTGVECVETVHEVEVCNGEDDDCDDSVDEGPLCSDGPCCGGSCCGPSTFCCRGECCPSGRRCCVDGCLPSCTM
jgi:hypothetical protein